MSENIAALKGETLNITTRKGDKSEGGGESERERESETWGKGKETDRVRGKPILFYFTVLSISSVFSSLVLAGELP